jgi:hypothetical protein
MCGFGKADDGVERRAQLVAHVGQEFGLGAARHLRHFLGHAQADLAPAQLRHVRGGAAIAGEHAGREVEHGHRAQEEGLHLFRLGDHVDGLVAERRVALEAQFDGTALALAAGERQQVAADQLARMIAEHLRHPVRHRRQHQLGIGLHVSRDQAHHVVDAVAQDGDGLEPLGLLRQHLHDAGDRRHLAVRPAQGHVARAQPLGALAERHDVFAEHQAAEQRDLGGDLLGRQQRAAARFAQAPVAGVGPDHAAFERRDIERGAVIQQLLLEDLVEQIGRQRRAVRRIRRFRVARFGSRAVGMVRRGGVRLRPHLPSPPPPS